LLSRTFNRLWGCAKKPWYTTWKSLLPLPLLLLLLASVLVLLSGLLLSGLLLC
jgi:hypothetical protein